MLAGGLARLPALRVLLLLSPFSSHIEGPTVCCAGSSTLQTSHWFWICLAEQGPGKPSVPALVLSLGMGAEQGTVRSGMLAAELCVEDLWSLLDSCRVAGGDSQPPCPLLSGSCSLVCVVIPSKFLFGEGRKVWGK